ncbi:TetR/AcrR family transcriptional regulator [Actinomadura formosensis]|uniref:TetR/AcrR family transcriptional regulator n=1 Tax=Actinomadura formosensis TaxID=60706 RepID=UPI00082EC812|nr:TetR/AcrR family transcriptional regulator [Actinomadura formosensis]
MTSKKPAEDRRVEILTAAMTVFGRYGYRRTSMEMIAKAAGISRPALYQHFSGREDVFRAMGAHMLDEVLRSAREAAAAEGALADQLYAALAVKLRTVLGSVGAGHRAELLTEAGVIAPDLMLSFKNRFAALVADLLAAAVGGPDRLAPGMTAYECADLLLDAVVGISQADGTPDQLHRRLRQLVELTVRGLGTPEPVPAGKP